MKSADQELLTRISDRTAVVGLIGLGYVGLPLMLAMSSKGMRVLGFDVDASKVEKLNQGKSPLKHLSNYQINEVRTAKLFEATNDFKRLCEVDIIVICVPTPLGKNREPDLSFIVETTREISAALHPAQLIVLESTTYPGTTSEVVLPILKSKGLKSEKDFFVAFSPEREDPGNSHHSTSSIQKIVGGDGPFALAIASKFYGMFIEKVVTVSSTATAEAVKITENVFRAVNVALVNELKIIYSKMGIDVFEVINAAKTKPFGYMAFYPGPGLGGHCIPIDPFYLTWKAREHGIDTRFIELAGEINSAMPTYVISRLTEAIDRKFGIGLSRASILVLGLAYKKDVDDIRESPALVIIEILKDRGAQVDYHDPYVPIIPKTRQHAGLEGLQSVPLASSVISRYNCVLIVTDHTAIDWNFVVDAAQLVIDTRNVTTGIRDPDGKIVLA